jgi:histidyl-tRNA synthetase
MSIQTPKGVRDFLPPQKIMRNHIVSVLQTAFEKYGYNPIETPALELFETLAAKHAGGAEILKETYKLSDQGGRELALRYDLTVPFARIVAQNPQLKFPFKRYCIDRVWRDGPLKPGRYREFWQCDCDVAGAKAPYAESELLALAQEVFDTLKLDFIIYVNHRDVLEEILEGVDDKTAAILAIDKLKKIGVDGVKKELLALNIGDVDVILEKLSWDITKFNSATQVREILAAAKVMGATNIVFDPSLARGLSYYTGIVYEGFLKNSTIKSSICAGGRYDEMIGKFSTRKEQVPACGISFGLDVLSDALSTQDKESIVQVYLIPLKTTQNCLDLLAKIRHNGINADMDLNGRPLSKALKFASEYKIPFVIIVGENELLEHKVMLRNMQNGDEQKVSLSQALAIIHKGI